MVIDTSPSWRSSVESPSYGDCFAYALAVVLAEPLLFKGDDFVHTDVAFAIPPRPRE